MRLSKHIVLLSLLVLVFACDKGEIPIEPHDSGDVKDNQVSMEQDYKNQLFYDLETNEVVSSNLKKEWDLGFESSPEGKRIALNTSKGMAVHHSDLAFEAITSVDDLEWTWDAHSGNLDSTAIGNWIDENKVYVVDAGYDHTGEHQGYYKLIINTVNESEYEIGYGTLEETTPQAYVVSKNKNHTMTYFSFGAGTVTIAPSDEKWDLVFTQYTHLFTEPIEAAYVVTGVLLNRFETSAGIVTGKSFDEITLLDAVDANLSYNRDVIGYNWKVFADGVFTILTDRSYIIRTSEGYYYKLRFLDFYDDSGKKGYPKFEFQRL